MQLQPPFKDGNIMTRTKPRKNYSSLCFLKIDCFVLQILLCMALSHYSIPIAAKAIFLQTSGLESQVDEALEAGKSVDRKIGRAHV